MDVKFLLKAFIAMIVLFMVGVIATDVAGDNAVFVLILLGIAVTILFAMLWEWNRHWDSTNKGQPNRWPWA